MGSEQSRWKSHDAIAAAEFMGKLFGRPQVLAPQPGGMAIWSDFTGKSLLNGAVVFNKIVVADMNNNYIWLFFPAIIGEENQKKLLRLDARVNYNRAGNVIIASADTIGMAISVMRSALYVLAGRAPPAALNMTNNVNDATSEYADLVLTIPNIKGQPREHYSSYDDGTASNMPGPLAAASTRDIKFYGDLDRAGGYPYVASGARNSVGIPSSQYNAAGYNSLRAAETTPYRSSQANPAREPARKSVKSADRVINGGGALAEHMTPFDGRTSNDPLAVALGDDRTQLFYSQLDAAENNGQFAPPDQHANRRLYEANYSVSGEELRAQLLNDSYFGPIIQTSGDVQRFAQSSWPQNGVVQAPMRNVSGATRRVQN